MSCVVGVVERGGVCVGADSAHTGSTVYLCESTNKLFRAGEFVVGFSGAGRALQALRAMEWPEYEGGDVLPWLVREWVPAAQVALLDAGMWSRKDNGFDGAILIAHGKRLFVVVGNLQVLEDVRGYTAIGCGGDTALGALYATKGQSAEDRVRLALEASVEHNEGVRPPFVIEWTGPHLDVAA